MKGGYNVKISCIVPIYNVEIYLRKCIDSILAQTFKDFELILVDDGGTDKCPEICDEYQRIDSRIRVIHKKNGGLSDARNAGIEIASGKYLIFIDSDDYIDKNMFEILYNLNEKNGTKISACDKAFVYENTGKIEYGDETCKEYVYDSENMFKLMVDFYKRVGMEMWNKLYNAELFDNVRFPKGKIFEDQATQYKLIFQTDAVSYINKSLYFYLKRSNSITTQKYTDREHQRFEMVNGMVDYVKDNHKNIVSEVVTYKILSCNFTIVNKMIKANYYDKDFLKMIICDTKSELKYLKKNNLSFVRKVQVNLMVYVFPLYKILYKVMYGKKEY